MNQNEGNNSMELQNLNFTRKYNFLKIILISLVLFLAFNFSVFGQESGSGLYYYDGGIKIDLQLEQGIIAEFPKTNHGIKNIKNSVVIKSDSSATPLKYYGNTTIWKSNSGGSTISLSKNLNQLNNSSFSPILTTIKGSQLLALPGNIIVELSSGFSATQSETFFARQGLNIHQKLDIPGRNIYEVITAPGIVALETANALHGKEGVISSTPNFWREMVSK